MVTVKVFCSKQVISRIILSGHANHGGYGNDLVCAGASSIAIGALNALDQLFENDCELELLENKISINVKNFKDDLNIVLKSIIIQLETMAESYPENIKIIRKEV